MSVTLSDVAKRAGVSGKTVSRVVNGDKDVSEETRQRILQLIDEMDYVPHLQAQRLASGKTRSIALHYPLSNPSLFSERLEMNFIMGIALGAAEQSYYFTLFTGELNPRELKQICQGSIADGLILMQVALDDWRVSELKELNYPFTLIGRCLDNEGLNFVDFDFENAVLDTYTYLVELGHQEIAFLAYPQTWQQENLGPAIRTRLGFKKAVRQFQLEPIYRECDLTLESGYACAMEVIEQHPKVSAFVTVHNTLTVGAINAIHDLGRQIPADYSIIGIALGKESDLIIPPLTTIHWEGDQIGHLAAQILINQLKTQDSSVEQILVPPKLVIRRSTSERSTRSHISNLDGQ
jgi:DNA-binding LacI/PurR family transcriptional regulator